MRMKSLLRCIDCGHSESLDSTLEITACPSCKSAKITFTPYTSYSKSKGSSMSSGGDTIVMVRVIFGVIGAVLLISGIILTFFDVGQSGLVVPLFDVVLYVTPLGITFLVVGLILLVIITQGECIEGCIPV